MRRSTVRAEHVDLAVFEVGPAGAEPVVIAPGVGSRAEFVVECWAGAVVAAGFRLVTYDLRGHARSSPVDDPALTSLRHHAADLAAVAEHHGSTLVGGISLGAHAALTYATGGATLRGLLIVMPAWVGPPTSAASHNAALADRIEADGLPATIDAIGADPGAPGWVLDEVVASWALHEQSSLVAALRGGATEATPGPVELAAVSVPTAVVACTDDPAHPADAARTLVAALPVAQLATTTLQHLAGGRAVLGQRAVAAWLRLTE